MDEMLEKKTDKKWLTCNYRAHKLEGYICSLYKSRSNDTWGQYYWLKEAQFNV